jgi:hypothetical protein
MRRRTELIFHVVREKRMGWMYQGKARKTRFIPRSGYLIASGVDRSAIFGDARKSALPWMTSGLVGGNQV